MKREVWHVAICLLASVAAAGTGQGAGPPNPQRSAQSQERPTLGPRNGPPTLRGPRTPGTADFVKLIRIHTLYIDNIDNSLSEKLAQILEKWGRFRLVNKAKDADATLGGSCLESRRLKHLHSEVFISDHSGAAVWQDNIYRPYNPPTLDQAVSETAAQVLEHLQAALQEAERR